MCGSPHFCCGFPVWNRIEYALNPFIEWIGIAADDQVGVGEGAVFRIDITGVDKPGGGGELLPLEIVGGRGACGNEQDIDRAVGYGVKSFDRVGTDGDAFVIGPDVELAIDRILFVSG